MLNDQIGELATAINQTGMSLTPVPSGSSANCHVISCTQIKPSKRSFEL